MVRTGETEGKIPGERMLWQGDGVHLGDEMNSSSLGHSLGVNPEGLPIWWC